MYSVPTALYIFLFIVLFPLHKNTHRRSKTMQEKRTPGFQSEDGSWGHITQTINPLICTIEYKCHSGFPSKKEAEESYQKSQDAYSSQIQQLKKSRKIPFTFSEYLDYWFREVYSPYSTSKSTLFKYRWVLYQIILPHLQNDILLDCVSEEFLNKLLDSCQGYCQNGGYYAYKISSYGRLTRIIIFRKRNFPS